MMHGVIYLDSFINSLQKWWLIDLIIIIIIILGVHNSDIFCLFADHNV